LASTACDTDIRRCDNPEAVAQGVVPTDIVVATRTIRCGSLACKLSNACQQYSALSTSDTVAEVCYVSQDVPGSFCFLLRARVVDSDLVSFD
jgi:hypothetical protein